MTSNLPGQSPGPNQFRPVPNPIDQNLPVANNQGQVIKAPVLGYTAPTPSPARGPAFVKPPADLGTPFNSGKTCPSVGPRSGGDQKAGF